MPKLLKENAVKESVAKENAAATKKPTIKNKQLCMNALKPLPPNSAGLGLRRALLSPLQNANISDLDFLECAPDNWIGVGGRFAESLKELSARWPLLCHGLSLSLGGFKPFDDTYLLKLRRFLDQHQVPLFSEHLSYCNDEGELYDLMPIPFTEEAVEHVAARIRYVQDSIGRRIAIENVSTYALPHQAMSELAFTNAVLERADCDLLLDVNNVYVNSINHHFDALDFIRELPSSRVSYFHIAGHYDEADDLKIDTHGANVKPAVWALLDEAYRCHGVKPTLLERDFNFPEFSELLSEISSIRDYQRLHHHGKTHHAHA
jgi:uncharacterized protein